LFNLSLSYAVVVAAAVVFHAMFPRYEVRNARPPLRIDRWTGRVEVPLIDRELSPLDALIKKYGGVPAKEGTATDVPLAVISYEPLPDDVSQASPGLVRFVSALTAVVIAAATVIMIFRRARRRQ